MVCAFRLALAWYAAQPQSYRYPVDQFGAGEVEGDVSYAAAECQEEVSPAVLCHQGHPAEVQSQLLAYQCTPVFADN